MQGEGNLTGGFSRNLIHALFRVVCTLFLTLSWGCAEHRMSLADFLQQHQSVPTAHTPKPIAEPAAAQFRARLESNLGPYRVGPGDVLLVTVLGAEGTALFAPAQVRIDRNGNADLPMIGPVKIADLDLQDVESALHGKYVPALAREASIHVTMLSVESTNVLVVGAVTTPGLVPLRRTERNLLFAIVAAGGVTEMASGKATLRRIRRPDEMVTVNLTDPLELPAALGLDPLEPGDIVYVQAAEPSIVYVGGLVNRPAPQTYPPGTGRNILQALAAAGGLRTDVTPREGTLIRRMPDGADAYVKLSLNRLATGKDPNVALAAGDILWVPETVGTRVQDWVNRNIFFKAGATVTYSVTGVEYLNRPAQQSRGGGNLQDQYDPFGFLARNAALRTITQQTAIP